MDAAMDAAIDVSMDVSMRVSMDTTVTMYHPGVCHVTRSAPVLVELCIADRLERDFVRSSPLNIVRKLHVCLLVLPRLAVCRMQLTVYPARQPVSKRRHASQPVSNIPQETGPVSSAEFLKAGF